jgi:hypothetical protein
VNTVDVMIPSRKLSDKERHRIGIESNINDGEWDFDKLKSFDLGSAPICRIRRERIGEVLGRRQRYQR